MSLIRLRPYQEEAVDAVSSAHADWRSGADGAHQRVAAVLPTGMGKTVIFSHLAATAGGRVLILVHRDELVRQTVDKLRAAAPEETVGVIQAERNDVDARIIVASVQTLSRPTRLSQMPADWEYTGEHDASGLIIVDECHHASAASYQRVLDHFPSAFTVGFTATLARGDGVGLGSTWQSVVYRKGILYGIRNGYLSDVRGVGVTVDGLDLAAVSRSGGDFAQGSLGDAMIEADAGRHVAAAYREHAGTRQGIVFAPTVAAARHIATRLVAAGIPTEVITGDTPRDHRQATYDRYRSGRTRVLASCMVLTEGFDAPWAEVAVIARPTYSQPLYVQMVGRVLRPWRGKSDALVMDVMGVSSRLKLASMVDLSDRKGVVRDGESLRESLEREEQADAVRRGESRAGTNLESREVDLFDNSHASWLITRKGVWFIPTASETVFLWPTEDNQWRVGRKPNRGPGGGWITDAMGLEYAMTWAEQLADDIDPMVSSRTASWRKRKSRPSDAQIGLAQRVGIYQEGMTKAELSDALSVFFASNLLDRN